MATLARDARGTVLRGLVPGTTVRVGSVAALALEERAARLAARAARGPARDAGLWLAILCTDLTTLEGADTPGHVRGLCARALRPDPGDPLVPPVAAVCVHLALVADARAALGDAPVRVASVAGGFPAGLTPLAVRLAEIRHAVAAGADEVDIVLNRGAFLAGRLDVVVDEIAACREAADGAHLKTILETGELGGYDAVRRAAMLAMAAGSDTVKSSTGKIGVSATPAVALCMAEAIRDFEEQTGRAVGLKLAGGIRTASQALGYLALVGETLGAAALHPTRFRLGASSLLDDLVRGLRA